MFRVQVFGLRVGAELEAHTVDHIQDTPMVGYMFLMPSKPYRPRVETLISGSTIVSLGLTSIHQNRLFCRGPIPSTLGFIIYNK